jgi:hypothetical protein
LAYGHGRRSTRSESIRYSNRRRRRWVGRRSGATSTPTVAAVCVRRRRTDARFEDGSSVNDDGTILDEAGVPHPARFAADTLTGIVRLMRRSRLARVVWLVGAVLQLVLPGATAWADARLEQDARSSRGASHIEAHHTPQCARAHAPDCALCQHLVSPIVRVAPARFALAPTRTHVVPPAVRHRLARSAPFALPLSRAPPLS